MAITPSDFSKIWASNADTPEYTFNEADYLKGWDFVGNLPPTRAQWNAIQKSTDEKMKYVFDNFGAPLVASTVAEMTLTNRVYVYTGSETGYTAGHWYYWNGTAWTDGGVYNSNTVQVDPTLTISGQAADAKATGDAIKSTKAEMSLFGVDDLFWDNYENPVKGENGVIFTIDEVNKTVTMSGTATSTSLCRWFYNPTSIPAWLSKGVKYIAHMYTDTDAMFQIWGYKSDGTSATLVNTQSYQEFVIPDEVIGFSCRIYVPKGKTANGVVRPFISIAESLTELGRRIDAVEQGALITQNLYNNNVVDILREFGSFDDKTSAGVTFTWNDSKTQCTVSGTNDGSKVSFDNFWSSTRGIPTQIVPGKKYYLRFTTTDNTIVFRALYNRTGGVQEYYDYVGNAELDIPSDLESVTFRIQTERNSTVNGIVTEIKILDKQNNDMLAEQIQSIDDSAMELYTEFDWSVGRWTPEGGLTNSGYHSDLKKIRPNTTYYVGWPSSARAVRFAFFDANKDFIKVIYEEDLTTVNYRKPDGTGTITGYVDIYSFQTPANARYISVVASLLAGSVYRQYVSSKPVFAHTDTGNFRILKSDAVYQKFKNRKLCMIGTSQLMTDRLERTGNFNEGENTTRYVVGIPEYLLPWWDVCDVYGYSSAPIMPTGGSIRSIYDRVVTDQLDLTAYDDFVITHSSSGITATNIGTLTNAEDLGDNTTFIGALRQIVAYVYSQNPKANIWVQTRITRANLYNPTRLAQIKQANQAIRDMAELLSIPVIDCERESGFNAYTAPYWCYDELGHYNHLGGMMMGLFFRKCILGF